MSQGEKGGHIDNKCRRRAGGSAGTEQARLGGGTHQAGCVQGDGGWFSCVDSRCWAWKRKTEKDLISCGGS